MTAVKVHAIFMSLGWMACVASGTVLPRFFQRIEWTSDKSILGEALWFRGHQVFMVFASLFSLAGSIAMSIDRGFAPLDLDVTRVFQFKDLVG